MSVRPSSFVVEKIDVDVVPFMGVDCDVCPCGAICCRAIAVWAGLAKEELKALPFLLS